MFERVNNYYCESVGVKGSLMTVIEPIFDVAGCVKQEVKGGSRSLEPFEHCRFWSLGTFGHCRDCGNREGRQDS